MNYQPYLNTFINFESHLKDAHPGLFNLDRVRRLLRVLGDPQNALKFIHVAGTKGKGSTCVFIAHILRAASYRTGLYTSPHLDRINERIRILQPETKNILLDFCGSISDGELDALIKTLKPDLEKFRHDPLLGSLTYFEVLTIVALCYFAWKKTDIVVLETGLGGRLDATNVVDAIINVITPISLDHTHLLGNTLQKIAREKAAIIKDRRSKVVVAKQKSSAMRVILKQCRDLTIRPVVIGKYVTYFADKHDDKARSFRVCGQKNEYKNLKTALAGEHQWQNAAVAIGAIELLPQFGFKVSRKAVAQGIREARWPARFEIIRQKPVVVVDCAHNTDSAEVLVRTFRRVFPGKKAVLILGVSEDKDIVGICRVLDRIARSVILTRARHPRAYDFMSIKFNKLFKKSSAIYLPEIKDAINEAHKIAGKPDVILATGSVFLAAQVRALVGHVSV